MFLLWAGGAFSAQLSQQPEPAQGARGEEEERQAEVVSQRRVWVRPRVGVKRTVGARRTVCWGRGERIGKLSRTRGRSVGVQAPLLQPAVSWGGSVLGRGRKRGGGSSVPRTKRENTRRVEGS